MSKKAHILNILFISLGLLWDIFVRRFDRRGGQDYLIFLASTISCVPGGESTEKFSGNLEEVGGS